MIIEHFKLSAIKAVVVAFERRFDCRCILVLTMERVLFPESLMIDLVQL